MLDDRYELSAELRELERELAEPVRSRLAPEFRSHLIVEMSNTVGRQRRRRRWQISAVSGLALIALVSTLLIVRMPSSVSTKPRLRNDVIVNRSQIPTIQAYRP